MLRFAVSLAVTATLVLAFALTSNAQLTVSGAPDASHSSLRLWLDSSDASTLWQDTAGTIAPANGAAIRRWDSKATSVGISVQNGGGNNPTYNASAINGLAGVRFSNPSVLTSTTGNNTGISGNTDDMTMVTVWQNTGFTGQNYQHSLHLGNTTGNQAYGHSTSRGGNAGSPIGNHYWGSGFNSTATADLNPHLAVSVWDGAGNVDTWYVDGTNEGANAAPDLNIGTNELQVGSRLAPPTEGFTGDLHEVIIFDQQLSDDDRNLLGGYIQTKYGITIEDAVFGAVVPEPTSIAIWTLIGSILGGFGYYRVRRKK